MGNGFGSSWRGSWLMLIACSVLALGPGCGDDDGGDEEDDAPSGEECAAEGITDNTCTCSSRQPPGYRQCTDDLIWTACTCRSAGDAGDIDCQYVGQPVTCWPCPGEREGRMTECLQDRTFDCSCRGDGGTQRDGG
jgi:hypothetical protein